MVRVEATATAFCAFLGGGMRGRCCEKAPHGQHLDGREGQADAGELDADVVRTPMLHQQNLLAARPH